MSAGILHRHSQSRSIFHGTNKENEEWEIKEVKTKAKKKKKRNPS